MDSFGQDGMKRAQLLIGQQLPSIEKLEFISEYVTSIRDGTIREYVKNTKPDSNQLNEIVFELQEKINELFGTPYAIELLLIILPSLLEAKRVES